MRNQLKRIPCLPNQRADWQASVGHLRGIHKWRFGVGQWKEDEEEHKKEPHRLLNKPMWICDPQGVWDGEFFIR